MSVGKFLVSICSNLSRLCVIAGLLSCAMVAEAEFPLGDRLKNAIGESDRLGRLSKWLETGLEVQILEGGAIPLSAQFSPVQECVTRSGLGAGWWLPLFESSVMAIDERRVQVNLPTGYPIRLLQAQQEETVFVSGDGNLKGTRDGDKFILSHLPSNVILTFDKGHLVKLVDAGKKDTVVWDRSERSVVIKSTQRGVLAVAHFADGTAEVFKSVEVRGGRFSGKRVVFSQVPYPLIVTTGSRAQIAKMDSSLGAVVDNDGNSWRFEYPPAEDMLNMQVVETVNYRSGLQEQGVSAWSVGDGKVRSDGLAEYDMETDDRGQVAKIARRFKDGTFESYAFNASTGTMEQRFRSGERALRHYIFTPGPTYKQVRRYELFGSDDGKTEDLRYYFGSDGQLLKRVSADQK